MVRDGGSEGRRGQSERERERKNGQGREGE